MGFIIQASDVPWSKWRGPEWPSRRTKVVGDKEKGAYVTFAERKAGDLGKAHSHTADEVMYILEGDMMVGDQHIRQGGVFYAEKNTVYGPIRPGQNGVKFMNVRFEKAEMDVKE